MQFLSIPRLVGKLEAIMEHEHSLAVWYVRVLWHVWRGIFTEFRLNPLHTLDSSSPTDLPLSFLSSCYDFVR